MPETRIPEDRTFTAADGAQIYYRYWPAQEPTPKPRAIVLLHRGHEHSGRVQHIVDELQLPGFAMFAWDARGHGRSEHLPGTDPTLGTFIKDLDTFARHITSAHNIPIEDLAIVAQSVGSVLATTWVHDYAPHIRCMVLAAPAFKVKLYVPFARPALRVASLFAEKPHINSYVRPGALTHDPERIASYKADPLIRRPISVRVLLGLYSTADRVIEDSAAIRTPTQVLISGADFVVRLGPQHEFFNKLGSPIKEKHVFPGFYHDTLGEKDRHLAIAKVRDFVLRMFAQEPRYQPLLDAHRNGYTKDEYDQLSRPLPFLSPKGLNFAIGRAGIAFGSIFSSGLRLGRQTGFDSGSTLDYIYCNQPTGITPAGKLIDWIYLNSIGWRGIRIRRDNIRRLLRQAVDQLRAQHRPVRVLDIAAGHGRYILETLRDIQPPVDEILLRDYSDLNVRGGTGLIRDNGLANIARFEKGDAFDRASIAATKPPATIGVVSGLYELFSDNDLVRKSLDGLAAAVEPDGFLIYTGQPWHPQLEMIARVLPSHRDHKPWVMRRRTQAEMDDLVENAGFHKVDQLTDDWGIFTVSLARRTHT